MRNGKGIQISIIQGVSKKGKHLIFMNKSMHKNVNVKHLYTVGPNRVPGAQILTMNLS